MSELDATDRKILTLLQGDGRLSNTELAARINRSESACLRRVRRLEAEGVIEATVALLNQARIGLPVNIFVEITLAGQNEDIQNAFEDAVRPSAEIMMCYLMSGDADYLLQVVAADTVDFERIHKTILSRLPGVARIRSSFALREVSKKTAYTL